MNLSESEFFSLSSQMSDRDVTIASLKEQLRQKDSELLVTRSERDKWQMKYEQGGGAGEPVVEELPLAVVGEDQGVCGLREGHTPVGVPAVVHAEDGV